MEFRKRGRISPSIVGRYSLFILILVVPVTNFPVSKLVLVIPITNLPCGTGIGIQPKLVLVLVPSPNDKLSPIDLCANSQTKLNENCQTQLKEVEMNCKNANRA